MIKKMQRIILIVARGLGIYLISRHLGLCAAIGIFIIIECRSDTVKCKLSVK